MKLDYQTHEFLSHRILRITIEDSGIGIPHEARQRLFQPFAQDQKIAGDMTRYDGIGWNEMGLDMMGWDMM